MPRPKFDSRYRLSWYRYKTRRCMTMHECCLCGGRIGYGDKCHDGGHGKRAHEACVEALPRDAGEEQAK
jgi:hypothetical protein